MRIRVLYTNGIATADVFWLSHDGRDVYCGLTRASTKRSYHASGKVHTKDRTTGASADGAWHVPLSELRGQFHLMSITMQNSAATVDAQVSRYSGKKSDVILTIDSRAIPDGEQFSVSIGLLEPGSASVLQFLVQAPATSGVEVKQVLLATSITPWVYVILSWFSRSYWAQMPG